MTPHYITSHDTTLHNTILHHTTLHHTTLYHHHTASYHTALHLTTLHHTTSHHTTSYHNPLHHTTLHHTTLHHITPHYITLHYTTSHHTTSHYTTPHHTTHHPTLHLEERQSITFDFPNVYCTNKKANSQNRNNYNAKSENATCSALSYTLYVTVWLCQNVNWHSLLIMWCVQGVSQTLNGVIWLYLILFVVIWYCLMCEQIAWPLYSLETSLLRYSN